MKNLLASLVLIAPTAFAQALTLDCSIHDFRTSDQTLPQKQYWKAQLNEADLVKSGRYVIIKKDLSSVTEVSREDFYNKEKRTAWVGETLVYIGKLAPGYASPGVFILSIDTVMADPKKVSPTLAYALGSVNPAEADYKGMALTSVGLSLSCWPK